MRRLLGAVALAALALSGPAQAGPPDVPDGIHCVYAGADSSEVGLCAGTYCTDLCGPQPYVQLYCDDVANLGALCAAVGYHP